MHKIDKIKNNPNKNGGSQSHPPILPFMEMKERKTKNNIVKNIISWTLWLFVWLVHKYWISVSGYMTKTKIS